MKRKKLVIISHTEHYKDHNGIIKGWGPTINEVNYLADYWEEVVHVACLHHKTMPPSSLSYTRQNISFVPIPPYGGKSIKDKLMILIKIPKIINQVIKSIKGASEVQLRLPTSMGLFLLPLFSFFIPRKYTFWVKYAGNWNQQNPPLSYRIQRWWLKKNIAKCNVTINGFWSGQPKHCHSFENPCLTQEDIEKGKEIAAKKSFEPPFVFAFVGRLEDAKGVSRILEALKEIPLEKIEKIHFIGDGKKTETYIRQAGYLEAKVLFHGFLQSEIVHTILKKAHFFLLPSKSSEGFPKVIAEAACYGAVPVVSNVGSIAHYVNENNGFIWDLDKSAPYSEILHKAVQTDTIVLKQKSLQLVNLAEQFTFQNYLEKLENKILSFKK